jgi:hypothetical protein
MPEINKVTGEPVSEIPRAAGPCLPSAESEIYTCLPLEYLERRPLYRNVSGAYRSSPPAGRGNILELRVDVDGRRPQFRVSGDFFNVFHFLGRTLTIYTSSFVVDSVTVTDPRGEKVITGAIRYYSDPAKVTDTIEVRIPHVRIWGAAADATVKIFTSGVLNKTYVCPWISGYFRTTTLEIDRYQGTSFPPDSATHVDPFPADLPSETMTASKAFRRAGIDMTVTTDDVMNDPDSPDTGSTWNEDELHDLMELRFDSWANTLQWNVWGVVVPQFGDPWYDSGYYGVMFDWGGWMLGDTHLRQGAAVAYDAIHARGGALYNTAAKRGRFFLETFIHEIGHNFNLPHTWDRTLAADSGSESFMNYPWGYDAGETAFWSNFRWEFDDEELIWMRHANRNDVIFGGNDWIGDNLSVFVMPQMETPVTPLTLELRSQDSFEWGEPVRVEIKVKNVSTQPQQLMPLLQPEDGSLSIYMARPGGEFVRYKPPLLRYRTAPAARLAPGESLYATALLSFGATGFQFQNPGTHLLRGYLDVPGVGPIISAARTVRIRRPVERSTEELGELLFSYPAAKLLYFGRTERQAGTISRFREAAEKYAATDPVLVRHMRAALGTNALGPFKYVTAKGGKRMVVTRPPQMKLGAAHLQAALEPVTPAGRTVFDNITYNRLSRKLMDAYLLMDNPAEAAKVRSRALRYLLSQKVPEAAVRDYQAAEAAKPSR